MFAISDALSNTNLKSALIPFITAGYPNISVTSEIISMLDREGVQAIELGIPYSDALADGPLIQESSRIALEHKISMSQILALVHRLSARIKAPIIIFTYLNPVLSKGIEIFIREIAVAGAQGLVIPDLPVEESDYFIAICNYYNVELILFVSPATSFERVQQILLKAPGCIYLVSSYGVTGLRASLKEDLLSLVTRIKTLSNKRIMLGFGISSDKQVSTIVKKYNSYIDAIVIGSAFIKEIKYGYEHQDYQSVSLFCQKIKKAM